MTARDDVEAAITTVAKELTRENAEWTYPAAVMLARTIRDLAEAHRLLDPRGSTTQSGATPPPTA